MEHLGLGHLKLAQMKSDNQNFGKLSKILILNPSNLTGLEKKPD
jgi:hypothetical protein